MKSLLSVMFCVFLRHKFGNLSNKVLKTVITEFYSADALGAAKSLLIYDVGKLSSLIKLPHLPLRHD